MKVQKNVYLNIVKKRQVPKIHLVQYDTGIQLVFTVADFQLPDGVTATLFVQKPSGKFVYQEDGISVSGSTITVDLENQAITEHGVVPYQLRIKGPTEFVSTFSGIMGVEKSLADSAAEESKTVISAFDKALEEIIKELQENGGGATAEQLAQIQTNTDAIAEIQNPVTSWALTEETQKYTLVLNMADGSTETHVIETDENNYPTKLTVNGVEIPGSVTVVEG